MSMLYSQQVHPGVGYLVVEIQCDPRHDGKAVSREGEIPGNDPRWFDRQIDYWDRAGAYFRGFAIPCFQVQGQVMRKQIALGIVFTVVGVIASQIVTTGQETFESKPQVGVANQGQSSTPDIEQQIRALSDALEKEAFLHGDQNTNVGHRELRAALLKYRATEKFKAAIEILETSARDMPGTEEGKRAELAIQVLMGVKFDSDEGGSVGARTGSGFF